MKLDKLDNKINDILSNIDIAVMLGTCHFPFARLVEWADQLAQETNLNILVQYGTSNPPKIAFGVDSLDNAQMDLLRAKAKVLICQGGPSIMMQWIRDGYRPIVVPRDPDLGEHIDKHQILFSNFMAEKNCIDVANTYSEVFSLVSDRLCNKTYVPSLEYLDSEKSALAVGELVYSIIEEKSKTRFRRIISRLFSKPV